MSDLDHSLHGLPRTALFSGRPGARAAGQPRRRWRRDLGTGLAAVAVALSAAGCAGSHSPGAASPSKPASAGQEATTSQGPWELVSPVEAGGLPLDQSAEASGAYDQYRPTVSGVNKKLTSAGHATSGAFGIYDLKPVSGNQAPQVVIFAGYNGTFTPQAVLSQEESQMSGAKVTTVAAGPHGGSAMCASQGTGANAQGVCVWVTGTTYAFLLEIGTSTNAESSLPGLMVKMRTELEVAPGATPSAKPGQLLARSSGSSNGNSASFIASTDKIEVSYTFKCGASSLGDGNFIASLTLSHAGANSYSPTIANQAGAGKTVTTIVDVPQGGSDYHISVISGCDWSVVVKTD